MSEAPNTSTAPPPNTAAPYPATISYKNHHHVTGGGRDYRKGNWTPEETLILITAKKLDDERRISGSTSSSRAGGELRWKWVENYCWSKGCLRSQNQCNDKWDNLLRDYKKVRDYDLRSAAGQHPNNSYWSMDKTQRKHLNLPSNMSPSIYEALNDVVQKKHFPPQKTSFHQQQQPQPPLSVLPPPPPHAPPLPPPHPPPSEASAESLESHGDEGERVDSETKRRRVRGDHDIGSAIIHSTELLSQTLKQHDDNKEKRHNQLIQLEHQRLQLEETRNEVNHQGITALINSINKLSDAIHSLISEKRERD